MPPLLYNQEKDSYDQVHETWYKLKTEQDYINDITTLLIRLNDYNSLKEILSDLPLTEHCKKEQEYSGILEKNNGDKAKNFSEILKVNFLNDKFASLNLDLEGSKDVLGDLKELRDKLTAKLNTAISNTKLYLDSKITLQELHTSQQPQGSNTRTSEIRRPSTPSNKFTAKFDDETKENTRNQSYR